MNKNKREAAWKAVIKYLQDKYGAEDLEIMGLGNRAGLTKILNAKKDHYRYYFELQDAKALLHCTKQKLILQKAGE